MKIISNQKGNITLFGLFALFISFSLISFYILSENLSYKKMANDLKEQLCLKKVIKEKVSLIQKIELINLSLRATFAAQTVTIFIPGLQVISASAENIKKVLKATQQTLYLSDLKKSYDFYQKGCPVSLAMAKTPYRNKLFYLTRDITGAAKLRSRKWTEIWIGKKSSYRLTYTVSGAKTQVKSYRVRI